MNTKKKTLRQRGVFRLSYQDSNLDKQNQNLMCYHYTIGQIFRKKSAAKIRLFPDVAKFIFYLSDSKNAGLWKEGDYWLAYLI